MLKKTPLHATYSAEKGIKLMDFGGWELPLQFRDGILAEHKAVRTEVGLFDVSHMGEISVEGPEASDFLDYLLSNDIANVSPGRCLYSLICREDGGVIDDLLVYVLTPQKYVLVVNASNTEKDFMWLKAGLRKNPKKVIIRNISNDWAQLALQGPGSQNLLRNLYPDFPLEKLGYYQHTGFQKKDEKRPFLFSRTGYTGEDGFELYCDPQDAPAIWQTLHKAGASLCGLGARDLLRLEARLPLYGHELNDSISPLEAGLESFICFSKKDFIGKDVLLTQKEKGVERCLYGLEMLDAGVPRQGYQVYSNKKEKISLPLGEITSGGRSPVRSSFIALSLLKRDSVQTGDKVIVDIRGKEKMAQVVGGRFYKRKNKTMS